MSLIDKMRAKQGLPPIREGGHPFTPDVHIVKPFPPSSEPKKPDKIKFRCGHEQPLTDFANRDCGKCREQAQKQKASDRRAKQPPKPVFKEQGRLPHGSVFHQVYDGDKKSWKGTLTLATGEVFEAEVSGIFGLFKELDRKYREWETKSREKE